ncbi:MAG: tetratricopeptide repeat protein [Bacteroidales bacterium]|nr:tetratricopeptide repeat protein [Bacteroidales bacterium]
MKKKYFLAGLILAGALSMGAAVIDDAKELIIAGDYRQAITMLTELAAKEPKNTNANLLLGDCYKALHKDAEAIEYYEKAVAKGNNDARLGLIEIAIREYRLDDVETLTAAYEKELKKKGKKAVNRLEEVTGNLDRTRNMLNRVEKIVVFDSINVPEQEFFTYYRLSPESGSLNSTSVLPQDFATAETTVVFEPESGTEMMWSAPDEDNNYRLVSSVALYGNEWDTPQPVGDHLGEGGDANYPFMMPDGITLYFANDGENSLGGYDIFITRRDGNSFFQPQNLGMPYNSPYNDYMLAIDETTGVGWWATDRNRKEGEVTIYMFKPADMRVNVDVNSPDLRERATLSSIRSTWEDGEDYTELRDKIAEISQSVHKMKASCHFVMPDGKVITRPEQLHSSDARMALEQYIDLKKSIDENKAMLAKLRRQFASGDTSVADEILHLEKQELDDAVTIKQVANEVIEAEQAE